MMAANSDADTGHLHREILVLRGEGLPQRPPELARRQPLLPQHQGCLNNMSMLDYTRAVVFQNCDPCGEVST